MYLLLIILVSGDFSTNTYGVNNNYMDLIDAKGDYSETFGQEQKKKTIFFKCRLIYLLVLGGK